MAEIASQRYRVANMDELQPTQCPCGTVRRAFADDPAGVASFHIVDIDEDPTPHYHQRMTEIYHVLEGTGEIELDGDRVPVRPGSTVMIKPGYRHRAVGKLKMINVPIPAFDPSDEWFD